jgi:hypothetical protein
MFQAKAYNEEARLAIGHRPCAEILIANPDARCCVRAGHLQSGEIGHAQAEIVLIRISIDNWWLGDNIDVALPPTRTVKQPSRSCLKDQVCFSIAQLRRCLGANFEAECGIGILRCGSALPCLITGAVLLQGCREFPDAVCIANIHCDRSGLADCV